MIKRCPNCGYENQDATGNAAFCEACGQPLLQSDDYECDFGAYHKPVSVSEKNEFGTSKEDENSIRINLPINRANRLNLDLFTWSVLLTVFCAIRFVFQSIGIKDVSEIKLALSDFTGELHNMLSSFVSVYYSCLVVVLVCFGMSVVLIAFVSKIKRVKFPVKDKAVFSEYRRIFVASVFATVLTTVYFILEISSVVIVKRINELTVESVYSLSQEIGAIIGDVIILFGALICMMNSARLANCRKE